MQSIRIQDIWSSLPVFLILKPSLVLLIMSCMNPFNSIVRNIESSNLN